MDTRIKTTGVIGTPASGMARQGFDAGRAASGAHGEERTAAILHQFRDLALIVHSMRLPVKLKTDIDHLVIAGDAILAIDSKVWRPGYYHQWLSTPMRGIRSESHLAPASTGQALDVLRPMLAADRLDPEMSALISVLRSKNNAKTTISASLAWRAVPIIGVEKLQARVEKFLVQHPEPAAVPLAATIAAIHRRGARH